ncbi:hypothetical protein PanWU01x14_018880 [Parasponia andersonii]|uniref:Uncharacterized protein n=1 Tax=Parasponia andersonii TaxID=3476 RepID=A0A2P5DZD5_PARAD|nr:hypothetical protein PanWU01x14_018880 [Parasponia andersonii]
MLKQNDNERSGISNIPSTSDKVWRIFGNKRVMDWNGSVIAESERRVRERRHDPLDEGGGGGGGGGEGEK